MFTQGFRWCFSGARHVGLQSPPCAAPYVQRSKPTGALRSLNTEAAPRVFPRNGSLVASNENATIRVTFESLPIPKGESE